MAMQIWVKADPWDKELVTTALETGADAVLVAPDKIDAVRRLGRIPIVAAGADLQWGRDIREVVVQSAADEEQIVQLTRSGVRVLVKTSDWTIIPLENLVARTDNLWIEAAGIEEATLAAGILERGVDGVILTGRDPAEVRATIVALKQERARLPLVPFRVNRIRTLGMGDRVCVDTCSLMGVGEGCLVGNSSHALWLMHAESIDNPYVAPRPFRVNAGPVHAYVLGPNGRTRYLAELRAGDRVLGVDFEGRTMPLWVGRVKIERRPLLLLEADGPDGPASTICQNAETIRLVRPGGEPVSVLALEPGEEVLGFTERAGRHFGHQVEETIVEK